MLTIRELPFFSLLIKARAKELLSSTVRPIIITFVRREAWEMKNCPHDSSIGGPSVVGPSLGPVTQTDIMPSALKYYHA